MIGFRENVTEIPFHCHQGINGNIRFFAMAAILHEYSLRGGGSSRSIFRAGSGLRRHPGIAKGVSYSVVTLQSDL
jgi:hypothetical protein